MSDRVLDALAELGRAESFSERRALLRVILKGCPDGIGLAELAAAYPEKKSKHARDLAVIADLRAVGAVRRGTHNRARWFAP
jgi:hypothetical protein